MERDKAIILAAAAVSSYADAQAIWCFTRTGHTAELLSMTRPEMPIVAFTLSPIVARRLAVRRAVMPIVLSATPRPEPWSSAWKMPGARSAAALT